MSQKIRDALAKLDTANEGHWTSEGMPRLDVMKDLVGQAVSRADITSAAKSFTRKTPNLDTEVPEQTGNGDSADVRESDIVAGANTKEPSYVQEEEVEEEADKKVEAEFVEAQKGIDKANRRFLAAQTAMDALITRRARAQSSVTTAHDVKAYQHSQNRQRQQGAARQRAMIEALAASRVNGQY